MTVMMAAAGGDDAVSGSKSVIPVGMSAAVTRLVEKSAAFVPIVVRLGSSSKISSSNGGSNSRGGSGGSGGNVVRPSWQANVVRMNSLRTRNARHLKIFLRRAVFVIASEIDTLRHQHQHHQAGYSSSNSYSSNSISGSGSLVHELGALEAARSELAAALEQLQKGNATPSATKAKALAALEGWRSATRRSEPHLIGYDDAPRANAGGLPYRGTTGGGGNNDDADEDDDEDFGGVVANGGGGRHSGHSSGSGRNGGGGNGSSGSPPGSGHKHRTTNNAPQTSMQQSPHQPALKLKLKRPSKTPPPSSSSSSCASLSSASLALQ